MVTDDLPTLPPRPDESHKGHYGRVLVIAGSTGTTGAGALASMGALRIGAGLVTWAIPRGLNAIAETLTVEVMTLPIPETESRAPSVDAREDLVEASNEMDAVVFGPGLPVAGETGELIRLMVPEILAPVVLDAGALRAIGREAQLLQKRMVKKLPTIITPHPGEMAAMMGRTNEMVQADREKTAAEYARPTGAVVVLKGAHTVISDGATTAVNETGNPGMATAGSGDVLSGMIGGLLAQGMAPYDAARLGVYLHGLAGDLCADEIGMHGMVAGDLLAMLPRAMKRYLAARGIDERSGAPIDGAAAGPSGAAPSPHGGGSAD